MQYIIASGATDGGQRGELPPVKLNVKAGFPLNLYFGFSILFVFSTLLFLCFSDYFPVPLGFSLVIHVRIHHNSSSFFLSVG